MATHKVEHETWSDGSVCAIHQLENESRDRLRIIFRNGRFYVSIKPDLTEQPNTIVFTVRDMVDFWLVTQSLAEEAFEDIFGAPLPPKPEQHGDTLW